MSAEHVKKWPVDFVDTVEFEGETVRIVSASGQPYVVLEDILDGAGLPESALDLDYLEVLGIHPLRLVSKNGFETDFLVPLRKVSGWLASFSETSFPLASVDRFRRYLRHCDDVLWMKYMELLVKDFEKNRYKPSSKPVSAMNEDEFRAEIVALGHAVLYHFNGFDSKEGV